MIILHRKKNHKPSIHLEERLRRLVVSFKTVNHRSDAEDLPYILEDGEKYVEEEEIEGWLRELESDLNWQRSLSGDGCYINPKNDKVF